MSWHDYNESLVEREGILFDLGLCRQLEERAQFYERTQGGKAF
jgi:hypothetical protein